MIEKVGTVIYLGEIETGMKIKDIKIIHSSKL